ncbi:hypothetical protein GUITHDRAFT_107963 [Guillardia theta CCMP2712]|uniref:NADAR domain-containing protein n=1 Tax=Guillardia theta (strain CCMP2712) TaxID=905079 RepID=L1JE28_GUITC|nr:hypothetical protein GUITHDRAFT_107963 [Guillardia theta CCMP2712]EKX46355.1 hypothetical protein GUITHDRAFT_107963 [Guillardia theta CCMP2712]|eukprot:XP_005833335.1 hypothetical protein GUITHDRAFT_107963 [Guillardia theta CCMP2712]
MGGKCLVLVDEEGKKLVEGPACTDNFQIVKFVFDDLEWHSVEQCFQGVKYLSERKLLVRDMLPSEGESDKHYGLRIWREGQGYEDQKNPRWHDVKVHVMYLINRAKYQHNPTLQEELLTTGDKIIWGKPSTHLWQKWNGLIQMRIRDEIRSNNLDSAPLSQDELILSFKPNLDKYVKLGLLDERME